MPDVVVDLGSAGHRHDWVSFGADEDGRHDLACGCEAVARGYGDFSDEARSARADYQGGYVPTWTPDGPVQAGELHDIVDQAGNRSTCDCQTLEPTDPAYAAHSVEEVA